MADTIGTLPGVSESGGIDTIQAYQYGGTKVTPVVRLSDGTLLWTYINTGRDVVVKYSTDKGATWSAATTKAAVEADPIFYGDDLAGVSAYADADDNVWWISPASVTGDLYMGGYTWGGTDLTVTKSAEKVLTGGTQGPTQLKLIAFEDPDDSNSVQIITMITFSNNTQLNRFEQLKAGGAYTNTNALLTAVVGGNPNDASIALRHAGDPRVPHSATVPVFLTTHYTGVGTIQIARLWTWNATTKTFDSGTERQVCSDFELLGAAANLVWDNTNSVWIFGSSYSGTVVCNVWYGAAGNTGTWTQLGADFSASTASQNELAMAMAGPDTLYFFKLNTAGTGIEYFTYDLSGGLAGSWSAKQDMSGTDTFQGSHLTGFGVVEPTYESGGENQIDLTWIESSTTEEGTLRIFKAVNDWTKIADTQPLTGLTGSGWGGVHG